MGNTKVTNFVVKVPNKNNYFINNREFRVVLEWVKGQTDEITNDAFRTGILGLFIPVVNNNFDAPNAQSRVCSGACKGHGWNDAYKYYVSYVKSQWIWDSDKNKP